MTLPPPSSPPSAPGSVLPPAVGGKDLFARRYRLVREIGKGGMGAVYEAIEVALDRVVAVKRLPPGKIGKSSLEARQRFRREVTAAARLTHPGIAQVLGFGTTDEGEHYIAMELVLGHNLREELKRVTRAHEVLVLFDQILAAIAYAHARKVVHSDLKPENVLVTRVGSAPLCKLLDFGVAKVDRARGTAEDLDDDEEVVFGTPRYMAPEQVRGLSVGPAADLYAIGVMLYEALAGELPIAGRGDQVMQNKLREPAPPLEHTRFGPAPSPELSRLCAQLLERDPSRRLQSAADARAALASCAEASGEARLIPPAPPSRRPDDSPETVRVAKGATGLDPTRLLPFVGRQDERARLADALARVTETGEAAVVLVEGPTGIGKTHLLDWFARRLREEGGRTVLSGAYVEGGGPEGDAMRAAIERHIGAWGLGKQEVGRVVGTFLERHGGPDADEECALTDFLRPDASAPRSSHGEARRTFALALVERTLRRIAAHRPLVVVLDDLVNGGLSALEMLSFLLAMWRQGSCRVLVVGGVRTPIENADLARAYRKTFSHEGDQVVRIRLDALSSDDVLALVSAVAGDDAGSEVARIAARTGGNPFFAIQLARLARQIREGSAPPPPTGSVPPSAPDVPLPESVTQLLAARVDAALSRAPDADVASAVLTELAVLLPPVATTLVERALAEAGIDVRAAETALDALVESGIVREVSHDGVEMLELGHPLLVDVLRARLTQRALRAKSTRALAIKEAALTGAARAEALYELARHALDAGLDDRAATLGLGAVEQSLAAGQYADASALMARLTPLAASWPADARDRLALLAARIADEAGDARFAEEALDAAIAGDGLAALEAALALGRLASRAGRLADAKRAIERAEGILESGGEASDVALASARAELLRLRASVARREGRFFEAIELLEEALAGAKDFGGEHARLLFDNLAWARHRAGDADGAVEAARRALETAPPGLARGWALRTIAVIGRDVLPEPERREHLERALAIARKTGALRLLSSALTHLGELERSAGNVQAALACFRQVARIGSAQTDHDDLSESLANLAMILVDEGQTGRANDALETRPHHESSWELGLRLVGAALRAVTGDVEGAARETAAIRDTGGELPSCWGIARAAERIAASLGEARHDDLAAWALRQAASAWSRLGEREVSARAASLTMEVTGEPTEERTRREVPWEETDS